MKKITRIAVVLVVLVFICWQCLKPSGVENPVMQMLSVAEEIRQWVIGERDKVASKELIKMIDSDPDYVIVHFGAADAKIFPGISVDDQRRVFVVAEKDSAQAVKELQKCVYDGLTKVISEYKGTSEKDWRQGWNNNNHATALLLIKFPLAERLGKKKEMLREIFIRTPRKGFDGWIKDVPGDYQDWWYGGIWPWPNEAPPAYWANAKN